LEGLYRHASTHAAGIVIGDRPLDELVPLYKDPKSNFLVTQYNMKLVEQAGLVKFDFLGLKTLTVLEKAVQLVKVGRGIDVDLLALPLDDRKSYELLAKADTVGVFQLESTGMRESLKRLKPDRFEDIIAMVALYRPGPMDNIPTYINRKHGEEPVDCLHPLLEVTLKETYGVIIYQEQVMQIAQLMAGFSLGQADLLRRAMGKKDKAEMAKQQEVFVEGALKNGVKKADAVSIFELVDKFAGYGFNKSHAAAYALISYHTAYMKANYREEFIAASMTLDLANTDKLSVFAAEAKRSGIALLPPCINASGIDFLAEPPKKGQARGAIRYSLAALKNIGSGAIATIVDERNSNGPYRSLADFASRLNPKALNKRGLETLSEAGAFDGLEPRRSQVLGNVEAITALAARTQSDKASGTSDLFCGTSRIGRRWSGCSTSLMRLVSFCRAIRLINMPAYWASSA
jgi:DNA polymerase III subunit alpha